MEIVPVTLKEAKAFVTDYHRHNDAPVGWKFGCGLVREYGDEELIGVVMLGRPVGRGLDKHAIGEVLRCCTLGEKNANSMLYGAIARAAGALGYRRLYTYTLVEESGSSLRACGWVVDAELPARETWDTPSRRRHQERRPTGPKLRWRKELR